MVRTRAIRIALTGTILLAAAGAEAAEFAIAAPSEEPIEYSPFVDQHFAQQVYWGDTHLHTTYSPDAGMVGNFRPKSWLNS